MLSTKENVADKITTIHKLKDVVTHFSEELRLKAKAKEEVTVAGRLLEVKQINEEYYAITLDDFIGETRVLLSNETYDHFQSILHIGSFLSVQGFVNVVTRSIKGKIKKQYSVVGYNIHLLSI